jgi:hypothetical protein
MKLGQCPCSAKVCVVCHEQETKAVHNCAALDAAQKAALIPMDDATLKVLMKIGKKCPGCGAETHTGPLSVPEAEYMACRFHREAGPVCTGSFIEKNDGCDHMSCGASAHSPMALCLRNGGCGAQFLWQTLKATSDGAPGAPANERQVRYGPWTGPPIVPDMLGAAPPPDDY